MLAWLAQRAVENAESIALIYKAQKWTYAELNQEASEMAARLAAMGVKRGDHVAVLMPNRPEYVMLIYAVARLGAVLVPLNTRLTAQELRYQLEQSDAGLMVCSSETETKAVELLDAMWRTVSVDESGDVRTTSLRTLEPASAESYQGVPLMPGQVQAIVFTSGTTGQPKGAMITFANHFHSALGTLYRLEPAAMHRWLLCMPLYHVGGLSIVLRCCLFGTTVVLHDGFNVAAVSEAIDRDTITIVSLVPTMLHRLIEHRGDRALPETLRCVLLGGAAAGKRLIDQCIERNIPIALTYGLTEACSQVATASPVEVRRKPGTVGKPLTNVAVRIVDAEGHVMPRGEIGEITVAGMTLMRCYYNQPDATDQVLKGNWLHTGDLGYIDKDDDLWIVQRRSDLIVSGGENVYPAEVEAVLEAHPGVKSACVVGIDDAEWGHRVAALIVPMHGTLSEDDILAHCRAQLAGYKVPRVIQFCDALPCTASGKVQRREAARLVKEMTVQG
jgi:o-succinylbenzoate---CoA ligase